MDQAKEREKDSQYLEVCLKCIVEFSKPSNYKSNQASILIWMPTLKFQMEKNKSC